MSLFLFRLNVADVAKLDTYDVKDVGGAVYPEEGHLAAAGDGHHFINGIAVGIYRGIGVGVELGARG